MTIVLMTLQTFWDRSVFEHQFIGVILWMLMFGAEILTKISLIQSETNCKLSKACVLTTCRQIVWLVFKQKHPTNSIRLVTLITKLSSKRNVHRWKKLKTAQKMLIWSNVFVSYLWVTFLKGGQKSTTSLNSMFCAWFWLKQTTFFLSIVLLFLK